MDPHGRKRMHDNHHHISGQQRYYENERDKERSRDGHSGGLRETTRKESRDKREREKSRMTADEEAQRTLRFINQLNDTGIMGKRNNLGISGRGMLLSGNHNFNLREAKYLARQYQLNLSNQSNNVGFGNFNIQRQSSR